MKKVDMLREMFEHSPKQGPIYVSEKFFAELSEELKEICRYGVNGPGSAKVGFRHPEIKYLGAGYELQIRAPNHPEAGVKGSQSIENPDIIKSS